MGFSPLKLSARDAEDVQVIAAVLQDAIAPVCDMLYQPEEKRFVMAVHRFCWDEADKAAGDGQPCYERVHCALTVDGVDSAQRHGFDRMTSCGLLELLTLMPENGGLRLVFAGGAEIRLGLGDWVLRVEDFGEPWPVMRQPCHPA